MDLNPNPSVGHKVPGGESRAPCSAAPAFCVHCAHPSSAPLSCCRRCFRSYCGFAGCGALLGAAYTPQQCSGSALGTCFCPPIFGRVVGPCTGGCTCQCPRAPPQQISPPSPASLRAPGCLGGSGAVASSRSPRQGQHNAPAGWGLPCGGGSAAQRPLCKCCHEEMRGMLPLPPPPPLPRCAPDACPGGWLRPHGAPPAQPALPQREIGGGRIQPPHGGTEPQGSASLASSFGKPRHAEVETWPPCKQALGPRGFLYKAFFFFFFSSPGDLFPDSER